MSEFIVNHQPPNSVGSVGWNKWNIPCHQSNMEVFGMVFICVVRTYVGKPFRSAKKKKTPVSSIGWDEAVELEEQQEQVELI